MTTDRRRFYSDLLERVLWTAVQSFLGALVADNLGAGLDDGDLFKVAGIAALVSAAKCLLATQIGARNTAATLPAEDDTPVPVDDRGAAPLDVLVQVLVVLILVGTVFFIFTALV